MQYMGTVKNRAMKELKGIPADLKTGDTKAGTFIAKDGYGNKFYENLEELPCKDHKFVHHMNRLTVCRSADTVGRLQRQGV